MKPSKKAHTANLFVKAVPGASSTQIMGFLGEALKIRVAAPPEKGKANQAIIKLLSESLGISVKDISLLSGQSAQKKVFKIEGFTEQQLQQKLQALF